MPKRSLNPGNNDRKQIEQLNKAVETMLSRADGKVPKVAADIEPLVRIAADLRTLPRESFKARLKSEFEGEKRMSTVAEPVAAVRMTCLAKTSVPRSCQSDRVLHQRALGAKETFRFEVGGSIPHAEILIGESSIDRDRRMARGRPLQRGNSGQFADLAGRPGA